MFDVAYTAGTWDLFHIGHLKLLQRAKALATRLIVGVSTDELVLSYKHIKPFVPFEERREIVAALRCVDEVVTQSDELLPVQQLIEIGADVLILGDDWEDSTLEGIKYMRKNKKLIFLPRTPGVSTSRMKHVLNVRGIR